MEPFGNVLFAAEYTNKVKQRKKMLIVDLEQNGTGRLIVTNFLLPVLYTVYFQFYNSWVEAPAEAALKTLMNLWSTEYEMMEARNNPTIQESDSESSVSDTSQRFRLMLP